MMRVSLQTLITCLLSSAVTTQNVNTPSPTELNQTSPAYLTTLAHVTSRPANVYSSITQPAVSITDGTNINFDSTILSTKDATPTPMINNTPNPTASFDTLSTSPSSPSSSTSTTTDKQDSSISPSTNETATQDTNTASTTGTTIATQDISTATTTGATSLTGTTGPTIANQNTSTASTTGTTIATQDISTATTTGTTTSSTTSRTTSTTKTTPLVEKEHEYEALSPGIVAVILIVFVIIVVVVIVWLYYYVMRRRSYGPLRDEHGNLGNFSNPMYDP